MSSPDLPDLDDLRALADLDAHVSSVRTAAADCRTDADLLRVQVERLPWRGASGDAVRRVMSTQLRGLLVVAAELDVAADALRAHQVASRIAREVAAATPAGAVAQLARWVVP